MKNLALLVSIAIASCIASAAAPKEAFSCEKIKDKQVRASCIETRDDAIKAKAEADAAQEREKSIADKKQAELDEFVAKAKAVLTENYKDPASAQFTNLFVTTTPIFKSLCGSVNAKNSYGGYVGVKRFFVSWLIGSKPYPADVWTEGANPYIGQNRATDSPEMRESRSKLIGLEDNIARSHCEAQEGGVSISVK